MPIPHKSKKNVVLKLSTTEVVSPSKSPNLRSALRCKNTSQQELQLVNESKAKPLSIGIVKENTKLNSVTKHSPTLPSQPHPAIAELQSMMMMSPFQYGKSNRP